MRSHYDPAAPLPSQPNNQDRERQIFEAKSQAEYWTARAELYRQQMEEAKTNARSWGNLLNSVTANREPKS